MRTFAQGMRLIMGELASALAAIDLEQIEAFQAAQLSADKCSTSIPQSPASFSNPAMS